VPAADLLPTHLSLLDAFGAYEHAVEGLAPPTVANHRTYLEAFLRWWEREHPGRSIGQARTAELAGFLVAEAARGLSPRTRRAEVAALRRWWGWLVLTGLADADAAAGLRAPRVGAPHNGVYTAAEVTAILSHTATLPTCVDCSGTPSSRRCAGPACARPSSVRFECRIST
jgi:site-specific recombinase XerD